ncbi:hypothetical protein LCGC14_2540700, partial [marine sediment metagenome]
MNNSNYRILQNIARYVDRGHLVLAAIALGAIVYSNHIIDDAVETKTAETVNLEFDLNQANARVTVLEYEYFYGSPKAEYLSDDQLEVFVAYSDEKELMIRGQIIPILTAQIQTLMPSRKGKWQKRHKKNWEAAGLPQPGELANAFYDVAKQFDHDPTVLISIMWKESHFRPDICTGKKSKLDHHGKPIKVRSPAGAIGCMQIMPSWVAELDYLNSEEDLMNWKTNIIAGADIFRRYLDHKYGRDNTVRALYLYNYGPK